MATIVVADADTAHADVLVAQIEAEGHTVVHALSGFEAYGAALDHAAEALFAAVNLPVIHGLELARMLRNNPDFPPIAPIVLLHTEPLDIRQVEACGATEAMAKGCDAHTVRERLVALLGDRAGS
jgi:CheY-like chemotaxis protein